MTSLIVAGVTSSASSAQNRLSSPRDIVSDASGNLYVADSGNSRIIRFAAGEIIFIY